MPSNGTNGTYNTNNTNGTNGSTGTNGRIDTHNCVPFWGSYSANILLFNQNREITLFIGIAR